jgi:ribonucleotide reductase alpha subunit
MFDKLLFNKLVIAAEADCGVTVKQLGPIKMSTARSMIDHLTAVSTAWGSSTNDMNDIVYDRTVTVVHNNKEVYWGTQSSCNLDKIRKFVPGDWEKKVSEFVHDQVLQRILG